MLLLPDQTYEQCQDALTPLIALKRFLNGVHLRSNGGNVNGKNSTSSAAVTANANSIATDANRKRSFVDKLQHSFNHSLGDSSTSQSSDDDDDEHDEGDSDESDSRCDTPESYAHTSEFFNNIPDFSGEALRPFSISPTRGTTQKTNANLLKECESYLFKYRIRPDFFCRYRRAME